MNITTRYAIRALGLSAAVLVSGAFPATAGAQAWSYPAFQPPHLTVREFNVGVADAGGAGTSLVGQWREQAGPRHQYSFDLGIADPGAGAADLIIFGGAQVAWQLSAASDEVPLDFMMIAGAYAAIGDRTRFRVPVGVSVGKRFEFEDDMALTPYIHPRLSLDLCNNCGGSDLGVSFDLGASFELSRTIAVRASGLFVGTDGGDHEGFGVSIAWTPPALSGFRRR